MQCISAPVSRIAARLSKFFTICLVFLTMDAASTGVFGQTIPGSVPTAAALSPEAHSVSSRGTVSEQAKAEFLTQPLAFEAINGKTTVEMNYISRGRGYTLLLSGTDSTFALPSGGTGKEPSSVRMHLTGANLAAIPQAEKQLPGHSNYFYGNDPAKWIHGVEQFAQVRVPAIYPGVDLLYYGNQRQVEHDFLVAPGTDPSQIRMQFSGAASQVVADKGNLLLKTPQGQSLSFERPIAWQTTADGRRRTIAAEYAILSNQQVGFRVGEYDHTRELVIDPVVITYSTYFGGSGLDSVDDVKVDASGNIYMLLATTSVDLPLVSQIPHACVGTCGPSNPSTPDQSVLSHDIYLAKLDPTGQQLLYSTYIGGSADNDPGSFTIAGDGTIYIAGETRSNNFPLVNEYSSTPAPPDFYGNQLYSTTLTRLSADGGTILYSTLIGGGLYNTAPGQPNNAPYGASNSVAAGANGIAYLIGYAETANTGGGTGSFVDAKNSPFSQGVGTYVAKFDTTLSGRGSLLYAQTFGPPGAVVAEYLYGIALDSQQNLWVIGDGVGSPGTPTSNALQPVCDGGGQCNNMYLFELDSTTGHPVYATYLGGTLNQYGGPGQEIPSSIAIDPADNIYLRGQTDSVDFPTVNPAWTFATTNQSHGLSFLTKLSPGALSILYSTYVPWQTAPILLAAGPNGIAASVEGVVPGYPVVNGIAGANDGLDPAFEIFDTTKSGAASLLTSSYLGDRGLTGPLAATFDLQGNLLMGGYTNASDLPLVNPYQSSCAGCQTYSTDGFLSRISVRQTVTLAPASLSFGTEPVGSTTAAQTATLSNSGTTAIMFSTPTLSDSSDFAESDTCNGTVAAGGSCTFSFTFSPKSNAALTSTFSMTTTSSPTGTYSVNLTGTGATPAATLTTTSFDFGSITVGTTTPGTTFTLSNTGSTSLTVTSLTIGGTGAAAYAIVPGSSTCGTAFAPNSHCTFSVTFSPTTASSYPATVSIVDEAGTQTLSLSGIGAAQTATITNLDFGNVTVGNTSLASTVIVTNTSATPLSVGAATIMGAAFKQIGSSCVGATLDPGNHCVIYVNFAPTATGAATGSLTVVTGAGNEVSTLIGTGVAPTATLTPTSQDFGSMTVGGSTVYYPFYYVNTSSVTIHVSQPIFTGAFSTTATCATTLAPMQGCGFEVGFNAPSAGALAGTVSITSPEAGTLTSTLAGTGVAPPKPTPP